MPGVGVYLSRSESRATRLAVRDIEGNGVVMVRQPDIATADLVVQDIPLDAPGTGDCVRVSTTAVATVDRAVCESIQGHAFRVTDAAEGTFRDSVARDLDPRPGRACGFWVRNTEAGTTAVLTAERVWIERAGGCGALSVRGPDAGPAPEMRLTDVVLRHFGGTLDDPDWGLSANGGIMRLLRVQAAGAHDEVLHGLDAAHIEAAHVVVEQGTAGVGVILEAGEYSLSDVVIRSAPGPEPELLGLGLRAGAGAHLQVDRLLVEGIPGLGVYLTGEAGPMEGALRDVVVRDIAPGPGGIIGAGIGLFDGAGPVSWERLAVRGVHNSAVSVNVGVTASLTDVRLEDIESELSNGQFGEGLWVRGSTVTVERAALANTRQAGVTVYNHEDFESHVSLTDVAVTDVRPQLCVEQATCAEANAATGVYAQQGTIELNRVQVRGGAVALQSFGGELRGADVVASACPVGLNLQDGATSDIARIDLAACDTALSEASLAVPVQ